VTVTDANGATAATSSFTLAIATRSITLTASNQSISFGGSFTAGYSVSTGTLSAGDSISGLTYTYAGISPTVYAASTTKPTAVGNYSITPSAVTGLSGNYSVSYLGGTLAIGMANQASITGVTLSTSSKSYPYSQSPLSVSAVTGGSGSGALTITSVANGTSSGCTWTSGTNTLTASSAGTCILTITKAADSSYNSQTGTGTFTFSLASQSISLADATVSYLSTITLSATGGTGTGSITYSSGSASCTITGTSLAAAASSGTCTITATKAADSNYAQATTTATITLAKATPTITWATPSAVIAGVAIGTDRLNATASVAGSFSYSAVGVALLKSDSTFTSAGSPYAITATFTPSDTTNYNSTTATVNLSVLDSVAPFAPIIGASALATGSSDGQVSITWSAPAAVGSTPGNGGSTITDYEYRIALSATSPSFGLWTSLSQAGDSGSFTKTISGLNLGSYYVVQLRARNSVGTSPATATSNSAKAQGTPVVAPTLAPASFSGAATGEPTAVTLSFNSVSGAPC